jgi:hypothetical protein
MVASGVREVFVIDGIQGLTKSFRLLGIQETEADAKKKEEEGPERPVTVEPLDQAVQAQQVPAGTDLTRGLVTVVDHNPSLLKSSVWQNPCFDVTPLKLQRRQSGVTYALPRLWIGTPEPKYDWDDIAWADDRRNKLLMTDRAFTAVESNDMAAFELALVHLNDLNKRTSNGNLIMVSIRVKGLAQQLMIFPYIDSEQGGSSLTVA